MGFGLGAALLAVGMTSVVVVVAGCILGAEVFVSGGQKTIRGFVRMLATGFCLRAASLAIGMTSVFVVVAGCILDAGGLCLVDGIAGFDSLDGCLEDCG